MKKSITMTIRSTTTMRELEQFIAVVRAESGFDDNTVLRLKTSSSMLVPSILYVEKEVEVVEEAEPQNYSWDDWSDQDPPVVKAEPPWFGEAGATKPPAESIEPQDGEGQGGMVEAELEEIESDSRIASQYISITIMSPESDA